MKVPLEIRHCRALIAVADEGGIARAASVLGVAQSTLSETLISLERAVGARMVLRQRGVEARLTPAAHVLLSHARQIVAAAEMAKAAVTAEANIIRVGAVESISSYFLPAALQEWRKTYPNLQVQVTTGLCADLRSQVKSGRLDVAVLLVAMARVPTRDLTTRRLATRRLRLVTRRDAVLDARSLGRRGVLVPDPHGPLNDLLESWFRAANAPGRLLSVGSLEAVKHGVTSDGAVGLLPDYAADDEIAAGTFAEADPRIALPTVELEAITATAGLAAVDQLIDAIAASSAPRATRIARSR